MHLHGGRVAAARVKGCKKKTLSYFNSTYQAFKKKRPVKTKNFPKLGDSVLPRSSCKAPNPAQALLRVRTQGLEVVGPWGPWNESHGARGATNSGQYYPARF